MINKSKRILSTLSAVIITIALLSGCAQGNQQAPQDTTAETTNKPDTITFLAPPISPNFQTQISDMEKAFKDKYPNLTLEIQPASWEDITQKLDVQVNAGSPPDIADTGSAGNLPKYLGTGMLLDISKAVSQEILDDYDANSLAQMKSGDGLYGLPLFVSVQTIGGNKQFLEDAGIDWKSIQQNGWTFEEFREAVKKGVVKKGNETTRYGFVFAASGVTAYDYLSLLLANSGMPHAFDKDLKYAYTSPNLIKALEFARALIDDGSMPANTNSIDAAARWNMMLTGKTMITGKGLPVFENSANTNNQKLEAKDATAVKDSIHVDYIQLPMPHLAGADEVAGGSVDGLFTFKQGKTVDTVHLQNVVKAVYFLTSGEIAAKINSDLFLGQITKSGAEAAKNMAVNINPDNLAATNRLTTKLPVPRPDITPELSQKELKIRNEVLVPKFQALLANEITPQQMYDAVKKAAIETFGEDGIVK